VPESATAVSEGCEPVCTVNVPAPPALTSAVSASNAALAADLDILGIFHSRTGIGITYII
jgi:hypothetical protein